MSSASDVHDIFTHNHLCSALYNPSDQVFEKTVLTWAIKYHFSVVLVDKDILYWLLRNSTMIAVYRGLKTN